MDVVHTKSEVRNLVGKAKATGKLVGLVPTMGALHQGHLSLMRQARRDTDFLVISIFVNPTQFASGEDLDRYPRTLEQDEKLARKTGTDLIFAPDAKEMYPEGFSTYVEVTGLSEELCGRSRPGHFRGVATVVTKLLNIVQPDLVYFGQKDAQQAAVLRRMTADLDIPAEIRVLPTVRSADGLALSSRNKYLSAQERKGARVLYQALLKAEKLVGQGECDSDNIIRAMRKTIAPVPAARVDYIAVVDPESLQAVERIEDQTLVALAVYIGQTRLIDNILVKPA